MTSRDYVLHSEGEADRLERQAHVIDFEQFLGQLQCATSGVLLDAGCGAGSMSRLFARTHPSSQVIGLDLRRQYLDYSRRKAAQSKVGNCTFVEGSVLDMPFSENRFDACWVSLMLHWLAPDDVRTAMRELVRVVRSGGWVVCAEPDGVATNHYPMDQGLSEQWPIIINDMIDPDLGRRLFPLMHEAGLVDISVQVRPFYFHAFGAIDPKILDVIDEALRSAVPHMARTAGSPAEAERWVDRFVDFLKRDDTISYPLWFIARGRKP